ncbi:MAG: phosphatase PAP2 family protein [Filimonas sp.]|nr:phosphatase PAP2 family protein [Filimonas sp.]
MILLNAASAGFWEQLLSTLKQWDTWLFLKINNDWTTPFLDGIFPVWREMLTWVPLYFFIVFLVFWNFGWKAWPWVVALIATVALSDQLSSQLLKNWINRPRPCADDVLKYQVRLLLSRCPASGSFTSSHATNHFAVACFIYFTLKPYLGKWGKLLFVWAATICYGQMYVGVHYPLDILGGTILGCAIGYWAAIFFNKKIKLPLLVQTSGTNTAAH